MQFLADFDDPIVQAVGTHLRTREAASAAAQIEKTARVHLIEYISTVAWIEPDTLWYLYWETDVPIKTFNRFLDLPVGQVGAALQPGLERECNCCHQYALMENREARKARGWVCTECQIHQREERDARSSRDWQLAGELNRERQARIQELASMPYQEYLQTPEWDETRRVMRKRAGYRCQVCSSKARILDVHHNTYANRGNEAKEDLVVLCRDCHAKFHGKSA